MMCVCSDAAKYNEKWECMFASDGLCIIRVGPWMLVESQTELYDHAVIPAKWVYDICFAGVRQMSAL